MSDPKVVMVIDEMLAWARSGETTGGMVSSHVLATLADEVESLRTDLKASQEEVEKLNGDIRCMVEKAADKHLPAYREQGENLLKAIQRAETAEADNKGLREALDSADSLINALYESGCLDDDRASMVQKYLNIDTAEQALK